MTRAIRYGLALALLSTLSASAQAIDVLTSEGAGLDGEWTENLNGGVVSYGWNATKGDMNARYNGYNGGFPAGDTSEGSDGDDDNRNEFWVLRFDLSGVDKSQFGNIELKLTAMRDGSNNRKDLRIWGVNPGTTGMNTFDETSLAEDVPGFDATDFDTTTQSVDPATTTFLGDFLFPQIDHGFGLEDPIEGDFLNITQNLIDSSGPNRTYKEDLAGADDGVAVGGTLQSYLRGLGTDDMAVFIVGGVASNGQVRVGVEESLDTPSGLGVDPTPILRYEIVQGVAGDFDGDNDVDGDDFIVWQGGSAPSATELADWRANYGTGAAVATVGAVPEPHAAALALGSVVMLLASRTIAVRRNK